MIPSFFVLGLTLGLIWNPKYTVSFAFIIILHGIALVTELLPGDQAVLICQAISGMLASKYLAATTEISPLPLLEQIVSTLIGTCAFFFMALIDATFIGYIVYSTSALIILWIWTPTSAPYINWKIVSGLVVGAFAIETFPLLSSGRVVVVTIISSAVPIVYLNLIKQHS